MTGWCCHGNPEVPPLRVGELSMTSQRACPEYPQVGEYFSFAPELDQIDQATLLPVMQIQNAVYNPC